MKTNIHPKYSKSVFVCNTCKTEYEIGSTVENIKVELCANCHPHYTGKETLVDTDSLVDKFNKRRLQAESNSATLRSKKERRADRKQKAKSTGALSLKDMLSNTK